jgi:putative peptidoglycan lipid II flippase
LIAFLFQRGHFTIISTEMTAWALLWYVIGLIFHCVLEILVRAFFSLRDTKTPALVSTGAMGVNIIFCLAFTHWFSRIGWMPLGGLALAISLSTALETTTLFLLLRRRLKGIHGMDLSKGAGAALLATFGMSATILYWLHVTHHYSAAIIVLGGVAIGGTIYGIILILLHVPEISILYQGVRRRFSRR